MKYRSAPSCPRRHAFTLVELMVVVLLMGIVAVTVVPAMDNVQAMRSGAARDDTMRLLELAKARALATGMPNGIEVDLNRSSLTLVQMNDTGQVEVVVDPLTYRSRTVTLPVTYPGVTIESMINGDGVSGSGIIWFDYQGNPHTRELSGTFIELNEEPAIIELSSDETILVHAYSGVVELQ